MPQGESGEKAAPASLIYEGAFSVALRRLKMLSISGCSLSVLSAPFLVILGSQEIPFQNRAVIGAAIACFGIGTTAILNAMMKTYVVRFWIAPDAGVRLETINLVGRPKYTETTLDALTNETTHPVSTFRDAASGRNFFLHLDVLKQKPQLQPLLGHVVDFFEDDGSTSHLPHNKGGEADAEPKK